MPERECSIQRRNQKVIEEAPSTAIDEQTRRAMGEQAVQLARKVGYFSAGTVEFLVDAKKNFYFLEMNTRLQVEHPITEYITGLDLVEQMIKVAAGEKLSFRQEDVKIKGWAIESRVYAEDPKLYLPCIGKLTRYIEPDTSNGQVRCDTGIVEGSEISIYYDPLICKLSTHGRDRKEALTRMASALDSYVIKGLTHNIPLLREVISHPKFQSGDISTKFLAEEYPHGFDGHKLTDQEREALTAVAATVHSEFQRMLYFGRPAAGLNEFYVQIDGSFSQVTIHDQSMTVNGKDLKFELLNWKPNEPLLRCKVDGQDYTIQIVNRNRLGFELRMMGTVFPVQVLSATEHSYKQYMKEKARADFSSQLQSPMPGRVVSVVVKEGEVVKQGGDLAVIEAMKMQNVMKAPKAVKIKTVKVKAGQNVAAQQVLMEFETI